MRWTEYTDILTGQPLLAACLASYKKPTASSATSCQEGTPGCMSYLLGVTCIDMGLMASRSVLQANVGWDDFWNRVQTEQAQCSSVTLTDAQMQFLRQEAGGESNVCDGGPSAAQCTPGATTGSSGDGSSGDGQSSGVDGGIPVSAIIGGVAGVVVLAVVAFVMCKMCKSGGKSAAARGVGQGGFPATTATPQPIPAVQMQTVQTVTTHTTQQQAYPAYGQQPVVIAQAVPMQGGRGNVPMGMALS